MALGGGHGLHARAHHVVVDVGGGEAPPRGLAVGAQGQRAGVLRVEAGHQRRPQEPPGPQLGDLHEEVHADGPEEAEAGSEGVDVEAGGEPGPDVVHAVGDGVGQLEVGRRPGLLHVVAGDGDRVEAGHLRRGVGEDVADDPHRRLGRVDVGVADHELLEDVVLDGPRQLLGLHALLLARHDVERQDGQHGAVHRHRHRHLVEGDPVEQLAHVEDGVDRHARHADVAGDPGVVGVVAAVGGQVERHGQALLAGGEVAAVEGVRLGGGGEPGVLADRPRPAGVHRRIGAADERRQPGPRVEHGQAVDVRRRVPAVQGDALGRLVTRPVARAVGPRRRGAAPVQLDRGEAGDGRHGDTSSTRWARSRLATASPPMAMWWSTPSTSARPASHTSAAPAARSSAAARAASTA